jgi:hypothetical protein
MRRTAPGITTRNQQSLVIAYVASRIQCSERLPRLCFRQDLRPVFAPALPTPGVLKYILNSLQHCYAATAGRTAFRPSARCHRHAILQVSYLLASIVEIVTRSRSFFDNSFSSKSNRIPAPGRTSLLMPLPAQALPACLI